MTNSSNNLNTSNGLTRSQGSLPSCPSLSGEMEKVMMSRKISSTSLYEQTNVFSQDSILPSMNRFINSINHMNHVVMVPSKLFDFEAEEQMDANDSKSIHSLGSDDGTLSHSSSVASNLVTFEVPASVSSSPDSVSPQPVAPVTNNITLYDNYRMLMQAKEELLWGSAVSSSLDDSPISAQFRANLRQLNILLTQFAEMADFLTNKYQNLYEN